MDAARIRILRPGFLSSIQDLGRTGFRCYGMPVGGAMDPIALRWANRLVGNPDSAAAMEITVRGPELLFERPAIIAVTGGDFRAELAGYPLPGWMAVEVGAGATLTIGDRRSGGRGYLAVAGGIDVPIMLGSRSTDLRSRTGGLDGRALAKGDQMTGGVPGPNSSRHLGYAVPLAARPAYSAHPTLRLVLEPHTQAFVPIALETLLSAQYTLSSQSDRMGYRLQGYPLCHAGSAEIISEAMPLGALQIPGNQQPILLMADGQTTGGYPVIAVVASVDIPLAAQLLPGDGMRFTAVSLIEAQRLVREQRRQLDDILPPVNLT